MEERIIKDINDLLTQLFQKMKEAGYEWDAEKKELKIEQKPADIPEDFEKLVEHLLSLSDGEGHGSPAKVKEVSAELLRLANQQKSAWSEEDEYQINTILHGLDLKRELYKKEGNKVEEDRYNTQYNWLKSLKNRVQQQSQWKPSERQKEALLWCVVHLGGADKQVLGELLEELNKL